MIVAGKRAGFLETICSVIQPTFVRAGVLSLEYSASREKLFGDAGRF
jgi:hypothetical protein